ncbi:hypothetical protein ASE63_09130 [Bosea sp. Root381]|uniref:hypothetical protein n=1 Tax=Bosea sp. Root381 TaxID=1736524 RepID=UPI000715FE12|nr:hypothetical protein [Bosea sp. Root381]KRE00235.1 hypothetical protein ASE63_09130 [Bosea sp. Root381]
MDFGNPGRTMPAAGTPAISRADILTPRDGSMVELSPEKTVRSAEAGDAVRIDIRAQERDAQARRDGEQRNHAAEHNMRQARHSLDDVVERRTIIDPQTRAVVTQKRNTETGETVSQLPDETLLKLRAYSRALSEKAQAQEDEPPPQHIERTA